MSKLRVGIVVGGLLLVGALAVSALRPQPSEGQLVFTPESVDLGRIPLGQAAPFRYQMRNVGDQPVRIVSQPNVVAVEGC